MRPCASETRLFSMLRATRRTKTLRGSLILYLQGAARHCMQRELSSSECTAQCSLPAPYNVPLRHNRQRTASVTNRESQFSQSLPVSFDRESTLVILEPTDAVVRPSDAESATLCAPVCAGHRALVLPPLSTRQALRRFVDRGSAINWFMCM